MPSEPWQEGDLAFYCDSGATHKAVVYSAEVERYGPRNEFEQYVVRFVYIASSGRHALEVLSDPDLHKLERRSRYA